MRPARGGFLTALVGEVFGRATELEASPEARSVRAWLPDDWLPDATAVAPELLALAGFLCGSAAVRGGACAYLDSELIGGFLAEPDSIPTLTRTAICPRAFWELN